MYTYYNNWALITSPVIFERKRKEKEKMFIQIKNIWYYNVYILKLKLSIKYFNLNITVTSHAEQESMVTRQISDIQNWPGSNLYHNENRRNVSEGTYLYKLDIRFLP